MAPLLLASALPVLLLSVVAFLAIGLFVAWQLLRLMRFTCGPDEVLVLTGRPRTLRDGTQVGYRVVTSGSAFRVPFLEMCQRMSLEPMVARVNARAAELKTGERFHMEFDARVRISPDMPTLRNAIERFLGCPTGEIREIAQDLLGTHMRAAACGLSVDGLAALDDAALTALLKERAADGLASLGLELLSASGFTGTEL